MPRTKQYNPTEVLEKAMQLFWENGYENTSVRMLEEKMGINQFSIYSSFGSKEGLLLESIKSYKKAISGIINTLKDSTNGIESIKEYFYAFLDFSKGDCSALGCLITNTVNESVARRHKEVETALVSFTEEMKEVFITSLKQEPNITPIDIEKKASYLLISIMSLANASKMYGAKELHNFIEHTFKNI